MKNDMPETIDREKLIARIEAMKREPGADNCSGMRISKTLAPECKIWNAALSAVIDMLGSGKEKTMTKKAALIKAREWLDASDRSARTILDGGQCTEEFRKLFTGNLAVYETIRDLLDKAIGGECATEDCEHNWVSADNKYVSGAVICTKCKTIAPKIAASGER